MRRQEPSLLRQSLLVSAALIAVLFLSPLRGWSERTTTEIDDAAEPVTEAEAPGAEAPEQAEALSDTEGVPPDTDNGTESGDGPGEDVQEAVTAPLEAVDVPDDARDETVVLRVLDKGTVVEMTMADYLAGVLRGETPASFEEEALKAQAVAARTYTRRMQGSKHGTKADICTDYRCCQAFQAEDAARKGWGSKADEYEAKIRAAVSETDGQVLLYDGAPILAVFHSSSPGLTQDVEAVWGNPLPYLVPVTSPEDGKNIPNYYSRAEFTLETFRKRVQRAFPEADLSGPPEGWLTDDVRNDAGTVETVTVGGVSMRGAKLRSILELRSACFVWETEQTATGTRLVFYVTGYGHGVGMSQYGANQMARDGYNYQQIVTHYYPGAILGSIVK